MDYVPNTRWICFPGDNVPDALSVSRYWSCCLYVYYMACCICVVILQPSVRDQDSDVCKYHSFMMWCLVKCPKTAWQAFFWAHSLPTDVVRCSVSFLVNRTNGFVATMLCSHVCRLSVCDVCVVANGTFYRAKVTIDSLYDLCLEVA